MIFKGQKEKIVQKHEKEIEKMKNESLIKIKELQEESEQVLLAMEKTKTDFMEELENSAEKAEKLLLIADAPEIPDEKVESLIDVAQAVIDAQIKINPMEKMNIEEEILEDIVEEANKDDIESSPLQGLSNEQYLKKDYNV